MALVTGPGIFVGNRTTDIIVPCYNGARYLAQTLESALAQTYSPVNVLVVDDGSTDASREIVKSFGDRVAYFFKENGGQASARNAGITRTEGDYVCLLDADDIIMPDMIRVMVDYLERHPETDICHSKTLAFNNFNVMHPYAENWRPFRVWHSYLEPLSVFCAIHGSSAVLRRRVFENFGLFPEDRAIQGCEDWHFCLQSVLQGAVIKYFPTVYTLYRQHPSSSSAQERNIVLRESELMRRAVQLFRLHGITENRKWQVLAHGLKSVALRWLALDETAQFSSLLELSRSIRPGEQSDTIETAFADPTNVSPSVLYLYLCRAFIEMDLPDLAALMFLRCRDIRLARKEAAQAGAGQVFDFAVEAMADSIRYDEHGALNRRPVASDAPDEIGLDQNRTCEGLSKTIPHHASFWGHVAHQLGLLSKSEKALNGAEARFRQAVQLNPNYGMSWLELAGILARKGSRKQAAREFRLAVAVDPECMASYAMDRICGLAENHSKTMATVVTGFRRSRTYQTLAGAIQDFAGRVMNSLAGRGRAQ